jgi:putative ABC transport system permease protein
LTAARSRPFKDIAHVDKTVNVLTDRLSTDGTEQPMMGSSEAPKTSLKSPVELKKSTNSAGMTTYSGGGLMLVGGVPPNFSPPVTFAGSSNPSAASTVPGSSALAITSGKAIGGSENDSKAMISGAMAKKNNLKVGDTFTAYNETLTVSALFKADTESGNSTVITSLPTLQRLSDRSNQLSTAIVTVDSLDNLKATVSNIKNKLGTDADVTSALEQATKALEPLASVKKVALFSLFGSVVAGAVVIFMMMIMIVRERRREIGILKAIGASNLRIVMQFMTEALTLTLVGAVVGLIIGVVGGSPATASLVSSSIGDTTQPGMIPHRPPMINIGDLKDVQAHVGITVFLFGLGGAVLIAMVGSACAGWLIAKVRPAEVMRQD